MVGMRTRRCALGSVASCSSQATPDWAEALGVGHDVGLADGDEIGRVEEFADRDLMADGPLAGGPLRARQHGLFLVGQSHPLRSALLRAARKIMRRSVFLLAGGLLGLGGLGGGALSTGVMRATSLSTSFCRPAGPRSAPTGAVLPSST